MQRTVTIKINPPKDFLHYMKTCNHIFNLYIDWCFENKTWNKVSAHKDLYLKFRKEFPNIPSAILQSIRDVACEATKAQKFKFKPHKKNHSAIRYDLRTLSLRGNLLTFSWSEKRIKQIISIPKYFEKYTKWKLKGGTIVFNKFEKQFYAKLAFEGITPSITESTNQLKILGVDRGIYNIISTSNGDLIKSNHIRKIRRKYLFLKRNIQKKGTLSAKRKLKTLSGKEKRFILNENHVISKWLVNLDYDTFVFEDLKGIRKQKSKGKVLNKWFHNWSFAQLESLVKYKAETLGKQIVKVDARYTSQKCNKCNNIDKKSRQGSKYHCIKCGYINHADINAAINIKNNYLLQNSHLFYENSFSKKEQVVVNQPNVQSL